jgi:hypothetical protein
MGENSENLSRGKNCRYPHPSSFVAFGATFPKGEGFLCGGNFQIST